MHVSLSIIANILGQMGGGGEFRTVCACYYTRTTTKLLVHTDLPHTNSEDLGGREMTSLYDHHVHAWSGRLTKQVPRDLLLHAAHGVSANPPPACVQVDRLQDLTRRDAESQERKKKRIEDRKVIIEQIEARRLAKLVQLEATEQVGAFVFRGIYRTMTQ